MTSPVQYIDFTQAPGLATLSDTPPGNVESYPVSVEALRSLVAKRGDDAGARARAHLREWGSDSVGEHGDAKVRMLLAFAAQETAAVSRGEGDKLRFGSPPEPVVNPSADWCDAYADWYYQGRG